MSDSSFWGGGDVEGREKEKGGGGKGAMEEGKMGQEGGDEGEGMHFTFGMT